MKCYKLVKNEKKLNREIFTIYSEVFLFHFTVTNFKPDLTTQTALKNDENTNRVTLKKSKEFDTFFYFRIKPLVLDQNLSPQFVWRRKRNSRFKLKSQNKVTSKRQGDLRRKSYRIVVKRLSEQHIAEDFFAVLRHFQLKRLAEKQSLVSGDTTTSTRSKLPTCSVSQKTKSRDNSR